MTTCGDRTCTHPLHQPHGIPVTYDRPMTRREWDRCDPDYDPLLDMYEQNPLTLVPIALACLIAFVVGLGLVIAVLS